MSRLPVVIDIHKASLVPRGYADFEDWVKKPGHIYIGRRVHYVQGTFDSKWKNPYVIKKQVKGPRDVLTRDEAVSNFYAYARKELVPDILELLNASELGC
jgi:hypothetical protein